jgi:hypothetical protein
MGPRAGLEDVEKRKFLTLQGTRTPTPQSPSHSLYRLPYIGSTVFNSASHVIGRTTTQSMLSCKFKTSFSHMGPSSGTPGGLYARKFIAERNKQVPVKII